MNMEAYKFETTIQENGVIQIPEIARFAHRQVEVFIVVRPKPQVRQGLGLVEERENKAAAARRLMGVGLTDVPTPDKLAREIRHALEG